jgi:hypothetical protein
MPAEDGAAKKASYGGIEEFVDSEKEKFRDFVKVKTAVGGNLYCAFYTIAECARYLPIGSDDLLVSIEKHSKYKLSDHIEKINGAFKYYQQKSFYKCGNLTPEEVTHKSAYAEEFKQNGLRLDIYDIDNIKDDFGQYLGGFSAAQEDWFDKLKNMIISSYII